MLTVGVPIGRHASTSPTLKEAPVADTPGYPATLRLAGRRVLVVGGGTVATRRIPALLHAGAVVDVIAPDASADIREAAGAGLVVLGGVPC